MGLPDGAQQHHQQQQAAQQLAALQSLQNLNPIALQNLLSQVTIAQAQHNFRGGLAGAPLGGIYACVMCMCALDVTSTVRTDWHNMVHDFLCAPH